MKLRKIFIMAMACSALLITAGNIRANPMGDTSGSNGQDGLSMDTMTINGTIMELNTTDSMLVLQTDTATDTLYITPDTKMPPADQLTQGNRVVAKYMQHQGRKELISVQPQNAQGTSYRKTSFKNKATDGSNGSNGKNGMTLTGTIQQINPDDSMIVLKTPTATDTIYFNDKTKMDMNELGEGSEIKVHYKEMQNRKIATKITTKSAKNGQRKSNNTQDTTTK
ncbi:MAG TPA: hypothetical protein VHP36_10285 [Chitinispirillaceae bacterium]|nr:hypothetical protein [Chitinispirillaceae bacterium]